MSGYIKTTTHYGNLIEEYFINNGKREGVYKIFDYQNNLLVEINYIDDKKNGVCRIYNPYNFLKQGIKEFYYIEDKLYNDINLNTRFYYKNKEGYYIFSYIDKI